MNAISNFSLKRIISKEQFQPHKAFQIDTQFYVSRHRCRCSWTGCHWYQFCNQLWLSSAGYWKLYSQDRKNVQGIKYDWNCLYNFNARRQSKFCYSTIIFITDIFINLLAYSTVDWVYRRCWSRSESRTSWLGKNVVKRSWKVIESKSRTKLLQILNYSFTANKRISVMHAYFASLIEAFENVWKCWWSVKYSRTSKIIFS